MSILTPDLSVATDLTPFLQVYPFATGAGNGFGTKYTDPGTLPPSECVSGSWSPSGKDINTGCYAAPWIVAYPWVTGPGNGYGTKYTDPASLPLTSSASNYTQFTPSGAAVVDVYATSTNPGTISWPWTPGSGFGSAYSNPGTSPGTFPQSTAFSTTSQVTSADLVITNTGTAPHITAWPWTDAGGYGTKYADPGTSSQGTIFGAFSPSGLDISLVTSVSGPWLYTYAWSLGVGWGSKYSDPASPPNGSCRGVAFSPSGVDLAVGQATGGTTPAIGAYPWVSGTGYGTKYSDPATPPPNGAVSYCAVFSRTGDDVVTAWNGVGSVWVSAYPWVSGAGFGAKYANPGTSVGVNANAVMFSPILPNRGVGPLGIFGGISPADLLGLAVTKAIMDNPVIPRRALLGYRGFA